MMGRTGKCSRCGAKVFGLASDLCPACAVETSGAARSGTRRRRIRRRRQIAEESGSWRMVRRYF